MAIKSEGNNLLASSSSRPKKAGGYLLPCVAVRDHMNKGKEVGTLFASCHLGLGGYNVPSGVHESSTRRGEAAIFFFKSMQGTTGQRGMQVGT